MWLLFQSIHLDVLLSFLAYYVPDQELDSDYLLLVSIDKMFGADHINLSRFPILIILGGPVEQPDPLFSAFTIALKAWKFEQPQWW